jgi:hypothetical protein
VTRALVAEHIRITGSPSSVDRRVADRRGRKGTIVSAYGEDVVVLWDRGHRTGEVIGETVTATGHREVREACGCAYVERLDGTPTARETAIRACSAHAVMPMGARSNEYRRAAS